MPGYVCLDKFMTGYNMLVHVMKGSASLPKIRTGEI